jgi:hypothetical protein
MTGRDRFEYATEQDPALNYCLWQYTRSAPTADKFRPVNLLFQSFDREGMDDRAYDLVEAIREAIGAFRTVFGIKLLEGKRLAWEFYFYDYLRRSRQVSISRVLAAIEPFARSAIRANEALPYFMFSLDVDADLVSGARDMDVVHMYVGNPGSTVSSGIAYALRRGGATLENFYFFFDARRQLAEASDKICCSAHFDATRFAVEQILVPELRACETICVANKSTHDCVYFSGIDVDQLIFFLERLAYPQDIVAFVQENRANLDHLLFDVGFDYRTTDQGLLVLKSGYYGVF